ncbi:sensor domain-containing diguanylate cyclase [Halorhodospira halochloris]|uniref:GGDEF domain-containing protein n=1 Tax=Halorhodospira halochloris TaxID=1052 RepID=UPI001EE946B8|nr:sensor domain-containing diguanylate cyclase [Halorhodospira halochloris]MCG5549184.1 diguanylate cyclase [Halorhodospira halochloris]
MDKDSLRIRFEHLPIGMYQTTLAPEERFIDANPALARILGASSVDELLTYSPSSFYLRPSHRENFHNCIQEHGYGRLEFRLLTLDERIIWVVKYAQYRVLPDIGTVIEGTLEDVTETRIVEQRLNIALEAGGLGIFDLDPQSGMLQVDKRLLELYGLNMPEQLASYEQWRAMLVADDLTKVEDAIQKGGPDGRWDVTFHIERLDGDQRVIRSVGRQLSDSEGRAFRQVEIHEDVTERHSAEYRLHAQKQWLEEAQQIAQLGYWISYPQEDHAHGALWWSDIVYEIFGRDPEHFIPSIEGFFALVHPDDRDHVDAAIQQADRHGGFSVEHRIIRPDGNVRWVSEHGRVEYKSCGRVDRIIGVVQDITEQRTLHEKLSYLADHDPLTGLANRRHMWRLLEKALAEHERHGTPFALIMIDIDHFKWINDTYGHDYGDIVLQQIADLVGGTLRTEDSLSRWGGEELLILAGHSDLAAAAILAERVRLIVAEQVAGQDGDPTRVTVSIGVASMAAGLSLQSLISRADQAMYEAKEQGRNKVEIWREKLS